VIGQRLPGHLPSRDSASVRECGDEQRVHVCRLLEHIQDLADADDLSHFLDLLAQAIHTGEGFATENRYVLPNGSRMWVRSNVSTIFDPGGAVRYLMVVLEDVTARRRSEEDLQRANDDLRITVHERTGALKTANEVLHTEIEQRKRADSALKYHIGEHRHGCGIFRRSSSSRARLVNFLSARTRSISAVSDSTINAFTLVPRTRATASASSARSSGSRTVVCFVMKS
jgi:hypothetical protein